MSMDARGQIAKSLVFMGWNGIKSTRMWLKPAQPQTADQGDVRLVLGGLGRASKPVGIGSQYQIDAKVVAPAQQSWISRFVQFIYTGFMSDATAFEAQYTEYDAHTAQAQFDTDAALAGLTDFDIPYKGTSHKFVAGLQFYELAKYAINVHGSNPELFNRAPYTTALASWVSGDVDDFLDDVQTIV